MLRILFFIAILLIPMLGISAESAPPFEEYAYPATAKEQEGRAFYAEFFKMIAMLGAIILALLWVLWFVKRFMNARITQLNTSSLIQVVESRALTPRTSLFIVETAQKQYMVAESQSGGIAIVELPNKNE